MKKPNSPAKLLPDYSKLFIEEFGISGVIVPKGTQTIRGIVSQDYAVGFFPKPTNLKKIWAFKKEEGVHHYNALLIQKAINVLDPNKEALDDVLPIIRLQQLGPFLAVYNHKHDALIIIALRKGDAGFTNNQWLPQKKIDKSFKKKRKKIDKTTLITHTTQTGKKVKFKVRT